MKENPDPDCLWQQLEENGKFTWKEIEEESVGLLFASFDTTSFVLCWVLRTLSKFPSVKAKVKQEIDSTLHGKPPTAKDLESLQYFEKFILESFRYMEFIRMENRTSTEQGTLGDYQIPQGFSIFESTGLLLRNAVENPDVFDPDRFNQDTKELSKIVLQIFFGKGPRACPGKYFALLEIKLIVVFILQQNNDFEVSNDYFNPHIPAKSPSYLTAIIKSDINKVLRNTV